MSSKRGRASLTTPLYEASGSAQGSGSGVRAGGCRVQELTGVDGTTGVLTDAGARVPPSASPRGLARLQGTVSWPRIGRGQARAVAAATLRTPPGQPGGDAEPARGPPGLPDRWSSGPRTPDPGPLRRLPAAPAPGGASRASWRRPERDRRGDVDRRVGADDDAEHQHEGEGVDDVAAEQEQGDRPRAR